MDRNREARRTTMAATNGLPRRRHRSSGLRDSPEEDGAVELQETARLRDRGSGGKKDRDRDRDRERERDRDRERDRERDRMSRSKRRRGGERLGGDESSEESVNDEEEEDDDDGVIVAPGGGGGGSLRMLPPPNPPPATASMSSSSSLMNHHHHNHSHNHHGHNHHSNNQRKSFPPVKSFRAPPAALKAADEMIGVSVPRKARSVSTKRSHEWSASAIGIVGDQIHRQASTSPVRPSLSATVSAAAATASASQAPVSPPSSSNASVRKKLKPNGPKLRQPKPSPKPSSSAQDEIEIEIAEVLYGMMRQPQGPSKQEIMANDSIKLESREANNKSTSDANKSSSDAKSRVSSPISSSQYGAPQSSSRSSQPGGDSSVPAWAFCVAPKRKKPRLVKYDGKYEESKSSFVPSQNNPISSTAKIPTDQSAKTDTSSANLEKNAGSAAENGGIAPITAQSHAVPPSSEAQPEPIKLENSLVSDSKPVAAEKSDGRDLGLSKEEPQSPKKESPGLRLDDKRETTTATKTNSTTSEIESQREEKFQIDLMAPPPSRSSPERDVGINFVAVDAKPMAIDTETEIKPVIKEDAKVLKLGREPVEPANVEPEKPKAAITSATSTVEESESKKLPAVVGIKERNIDLQLDLEKTDVIRESVSVGVGGNKLRQLALPRQHQQQPPSQPNNEKPAQSGALPLPTMPMAAWPGGLPPMGYMTPLQGVVSMDGNAVSSAAIQPQPYIFNQPRPKRCATHCYIARSISVHQQIARMNSFWPAAAAAGSGPLYGAKPCNLNVVPSSADMHSNIPGGRGVNPVQDKGQGLAMFPGHNGKDKASQAAAGVVETAHRKQILLQQPLPPGAPSNILQGPTAIIFPLSQQQAVAAAAASVRPGSVKSPPAAGNATTSSGSNSTAAAASATAAAAAGAPAMTFNYPNMAGNEHPQYLAINAYSFPIPAHVGAPPAYRGTHPQAMSFFNGSFYSTFHPSQLQQQQPPAHSQQSQQGHQNPSMSSGSSSSQKHLQNQQQSQRQPHTGGVNAGSGGSLQGFPTSKNPPSQPMQMQQRQQQAQHMAHPARQLESEMGSEDSPSTADSRVSRPSMSIYGQNFAMPIHAPNFALMTPASMAAAGGANSSSGAGANGSSGGNGEKKQPQQQGQKGGGVEPSQAFAMSFGAINGATTGPPGLDITSLAHQQAIFPDIRQGYQQYMAVAAAAAAQAQAAAHHKKNYRGPEDVKAGGDSSNVEEDRKAMKGSSGVSQSIAFSRPDLSDASGNALPGATVVDSSARTLNLGSAQQRSSGSVMPAGMTNANASSAQQQLQRNQQQQQQQHIMQMQKQQQQQQQQQLAAAARTKTPPTSNGSVYSDHLSSSMAAKFPNALSTFPQSLVHSSSSPAHSPQWKNTARSTTAQVPSPSMTSSTSSSLKNLSQQQGRPQQTHTQISFAAANPKPAVTQSPGLQPVNSNQSPSPPIMVGSPTTSSVSKSAGGSPRTATNSTSTGNKVGQASSLSSQQAKNSTSVPNMKSSPATGKNVPSILGNPHITSSSGATGNKSQLAQQQPQLSKQSLQQAQIYFSSYIPTQAHPNSTTATTAASGGYYTQRRRPEQQQQLQGVSGTSSSGMLSLSPSVTLSNTSTSDPAKAAAAAAAANMKGLPSQALMHPAQFAAAAAAAAAAAQSGNPHQILPAGFPYVHTVPAAVQVKPAEQKQPAGE